MKNIIKYIILFILIFLIFHSYTNASKNLNIIQQNKIFNQWTINWNDFSFDFWYWNKLIPDNFNPIKITFKNTFNWKLLIYKSEIYNYNKSEKKFFKAININSTKLNTFLYLKYFNYDFYLEENNNKVYIWKINIIHQNTNLFISKETINDKNSIIEINNPLELIPFNSIIIDKKTLSNTEIKYILDFVYKWNQVFINQKIFEQYFLKLIKNNNIKKKSFLYKKIKNDYYNYGFWSIIIKNINENYIDNWYSNYKENKIISNNVKDLIIDDIFKSKVVPYYIIILFLFIYFLVIIPINFYIFKKNQNKFYLLYSTPIIAIIFLIILFTMNFLYKWIKDIENKIELNHIKDWKIYQEVFIYTYSPFWWKYKIEIETSDFKKNIYHYNTENDFTYKNDKIITTYPNVYPSSLIKYTYSQIIENSNTKIDYDNIYNLKEFKAKYNYYINTNSTIKTIWIKQIETEYMKKYNFAWEKNYNLKIDIFYK